jgi:hypothetical protein
MKLSLGPRTLSLYRVISIFINLETAKSCRPIPGFLDAPLPAPKTVWSASDASTWEKEYQLYFEQFGNGDWLTNGALILMHAGAGTDGGARWDDWFAGIDGMGVLVVVATSMLV